MRFPDGPSGVVIDTPPAPRRQALRSSRTVLSIARLAGPRVEVRAQRIRGDVGHQAEVDGLEVHQQRVGQHVVGAVRLVVESAAIVALRREVAVVDDHVAGDALDALLAQAGDETPPAVGTS